LDFFLIGLSLTAAAVSFITTLLCTKPLIERFKEAKLTGIDVHKPSRPEIPEMGGIAIIIGFLIGLISLLLLVSHPRILYILAAVVTIFLMAFIGIIDDLTRLTQNWKPLLAALAAIPLVIIRVGYSTIFLPFLGFVDIGLLYWYLVVPLGVTLAANGFNSLAGFNGLEAGIAVIISLFLTVEAIILNVSETAIMTAALMGASLAFLRYNRYPAKVFPGDTGTLTIGAIIASAVIIGRMEWIGVLTFTPHLINYILIFSTSKRLTSSSEFRPTAVLTDGTLCSSPSMNQRITLADLILSIKRMKEPELVKLLWAFEILACIMSLILTFHYAGLLQFSS